MDADTLRLAKTYPYPAPEGSYVLKDGGPRELADSAPVPGLDGRTPVLAVGSNRAPEQLARKFAPLGGATIPVSRARLADFDAVYSAHFTSYGAIPATLQHAPGTTVMLSVTWLTAPQLVRMHETEVASENYSFGELSELRLETAGRVLGRVFAYVSRRGCLTDAGRPVALAEVAAEERHWPALTQEEMLGRARDRLAPRQALDELTGDGTVRIGAITRIRDLGSDGRLPVHLAALTHALGSIRGTQIRNRGTLGGELCQWPRCWYFRHGYGLVARIDGQEHYHGSHHTQNNFTHRSPQFAKTRGPT